MTEQRERNKKDIFIKFHKAFRPLYMETDSLDVGLGAR